MDKKLMNDRMNAFQRETIFEYADLPEDFYDLVAVTLKKNSPVDLKMMVPDFVTICKKTNMEQRFSLWEAGAVFYALERMTANDFGYGLTEYGVYLQELEKMIMAWRGILQPFADKLGQELADFQKKEQEEKQAAFDQAREKEGKPAPMTISLNPAEA